MAIPNNIKVLLDYNIYNDDTTSINTNLEKNKDKDKDKDKDNVKTNKKMKGGSLQLVKHNSIQYKPNMTFSKINTDSVLFTLVKITNDTIKSFHYKESPFLISSEFNDLITKMNKQSDNINIIIFYSEDKQQTAILELSTNTITINNLPQNIGDLLKPTKIYNYNIPTHRYTNGADQIELIDELKYNRKKLILKINNPIVFTRIPRSSNFNSDGTINLLTTDENTQKEEENKAINDAAYAAAVAAATITIVFYSKTPIELLIDATENGTVSNNITITMDNLFAINNKLNIESNEFTIFKQLQSSWTYNLNSYDTLYNESIKFKNELNIINITNLKQRIIDKLIDYYKINDGNYKNYNEYNNDQIISSQLINKYTENYSMINEDVRIIITTEFEIFLNQIPQLIFREYLKKIYQNIVELDNNNIPINIRFIKSNAPNFYIYSFDWNKQAYDEVTPEVKFEQNKIKSKEAIDKANNISNKITEINIKNEELTQLLENIIDSINSIQSNKRLKYKQLDKQTCKNDIDDYFNKYKSIIQLIKTTYEFSIEEINLNTNKNNLDLINTIIIPLINNELLPFNLDQSDKNNKVTNHSAAPSSEVDSNSQLKVRFAKVAAKYINEIREIKYKPEKQEQIKEMIPPIREIRQQLIKILNIFNDNIYYNYYNNNKKYKNICKSTSILIFNSLINYIELLYTLYKYASSCYGRFTHVQDFNIALDTINIDIIKFKIEYLKYENPNNISLINENEKLKLYQNDVDIQTKNKNSKPKKTNFNEDSNEDDEDYEPEQTLSLERTNSENMIDTRKRGRLFDNSGGTPNNKLTTTLQNYFTLYEPLQNIYCKGVNTCNLSNNMPNKIIVSKKDNEGDKQNLLSSIWEAITKYNTKNASNPIKYNNNKSNRQTDIDTNNISSFFNKIYEKITDENSQSENIYKKYKAHFNYISKYKLSNIADLKNKLKYDKDPLIQLLITDKLPIKLNDGTTGIELINNDRFNSIFSSGIFIIDDIYINSFQKILRNLFKIHLIIIDINFEIKKCPTDIDENDFFIFLLKDNTNTYYLISYNTITEYFIYTYNSFNISINDINKLGDTSPPLFIYLYLSEKCEDLRKDLFENLYDTFINPSLYKDKETEITNTLEKIKQDIPKINNLSISSTSGINIYRNITTSQYCYYITVTLNLYKDSTTKPSACELKKNNILSDINVLTGLKTFAGTNLTTNNNIYTNKNPQDITNMSWYGGLFKGVNALTKISMKQEGNNFTKKRMILSHKKRNNMKRDINKIKIRLSRKLRNNTTRKLFN